MLLHLGFYERHQIVDTPLYERYGEAILDGEVPYRDFELGYPPGALPVFVLPAFASAERYRDVFEWLMILCAAAAIGFGGLSLRSAGSRVARLFAATAFIALAPLALGSVVLSRYDFWPAALTAAALAALLGGRVLVAAFVLALAVAAKLYALAVLPLALIFLGRVHGRRRALTALGVFALVLTFMLLPFALAGDGLADATRAQTVGRSLQIESLGAALLLSAHQLGAYRATVEHAPGGHVLVGRLPDLLTTLSSIAQVLAVIAVWWLYRRGPPFHDRLLTAAAAAVVGFIAFGRVFSPQYLVWLVALVPLIAGRTGLVASGLLLSALVLTQLWFPSRYVDLVALGDVTWLVLARNAVLVALFALLMRALLRSGRAPVL